MERCDLGSITWLIVRRMPSMQTVGAMKAREVNSLRLNLREACRSHPIGSGNLDVARKLHPMVCMESTLPKRLSRSGTAPGGSGHGYMVRNYQLPTVCGHSNDVITAHLCLWQKWRNIPMLTQGGHGLRWNYEPPCWSFPTHLPPPLCCRPQDSARTSKC